MIAELRRIVQEAKDELSRQGQAGNAGRQYSSRGNQRRQGGHSDAAAASDPALADAYRTLGVSPDISDEELKRVYRQTMREVHPDTLANSGLSRRLQELAAEQAKAINAAYHLIVEERRRRGGG
jgi:DnaJ-domain-containing protein 1